MPTKVFVGNLPENCAQETIRDVFGSYGGIDEVAIVKNFAFVHFSNEGDANNAVRDLDGSKIGGKQINVEISKKQDGSVLRGGRRDNRENRDRDRDRNDRNDRNDRGQRRGRGGPDRSHNTGGILGAGPMAGGPPFGGGPQLGGLGGPQLGGLGGPQLGGLGGPQLGGLGGPQLGGLGGPQLGGLGGPQLGGLGGPQLGGLGGGGPLGALGGGGAAAPLGGLGILSAVNTLAAVAEKQQQLNSGQQQQQQQQPFQERRTERDQPDPDVRVRREVVHTRDVPNATAMGLSSGYVIYERYYVDPTHPLLKGLPLPELPRMSDGLASRDNTRSDTRRDSFDGFRDRSPVNNGRRSELERDRDYQGDYRR